MTGTVPQSGRVSGGRHAARHRATGRGSGKRRRSGPAAGSGPGAGPGGPGSPPVRESRGLAAVRVMGEVFITLGVVLFLFVAYELWWTNVAADNHSRGEAQRLQKQWDGAHGSAAAYPKSFSYGTVFAIIYIPKLDVQAPIAEGTGKQSILDKGEVGHYTGALETAFPWARTGNFALAGHRNTHGEPFRYINKLVPGDEVIVEAAHDYYTYKITNTLPQTSPGNVDTITPVPKESGFTGPGRYITLTTCTPEFTSEYRLIVWGKLVEDRPRSEGKPKALTGG